MSTEKQSIYVDQLHNSPEWKRMERFQEEATMTLPEIYENANREAEEDEMGDLSDDMQTREEETMMEYAIEISRSRKQGYIEGIKKAIQIIAEYECTCCDYGKDGEPLGCNCARTQDTIIKALEKEMKDGQR